MTLVDTFLTLAEAADRIAPGPCEVLPLDLDRDWPEIDRLLVHEEWPFVRADLEVGDAQPVSANLVARIAESFAGFFTTHAFHDVGYLDMMVVDPNHRGSTVARPLYLRALRSLQDQGVGGLVVHSTNDSARLIRLLGFTPGMDFTLRMREPAEGGGEIRELRDREALIASDAEVFGARREAWIDALLATPGVRFVAVDGAHACLRPRRDGAMCIDGVCAEDPSTVPHLVDAIVAAFGDRPLHCFGRTESALDLALRAHSFDVPAFFEPIGPLVEWRQGKTRDFGTSERVQSLMWL
ncbi:MAG: GNAT family N-acetyltransferase [Deltaproteobacteria bacterium]|nr:MAG: GNAT family N-acetyltransferase [Deltaproteobacteria bacterium]